MTRNPDLPCADCGKLLWRKKESLPAGQARCLECRRSMRPGETICPVCSQLFEPKRRGGMGWTTVCSQYCAQVRRVGGVFDPKLKDAPPEEHNKAMCRRRRELIKVNGGDLKRKFDRLEIFERDGWICHICKEPVDRLLPGRSPMGASIDHIVSLFDGGEHSRANVALAHFSCNAKRGNARRVKLGG